MNTEETSIIATGLSKRFGPHRAISNLSFTIRKGQIVGFLGPNGAGKSTTLRILTGIIPATSGYLSIAGLSAPYHPEEIRRQIGYMPENNPLPEDMRVVEYLKFRAKLKGVPVRQRKSRIEHAMEVCELHRKARRKIIGSLSKGFRQRVGIADAILAAPPITILDEPTIGLDPHQVIAIRKLLDNLRGETTVIFSSHILSEVEISCDRILILNQGHLVAQGTAEELREEFLPGMRYQFEAAGDKEEIRKLLDELDATWQFTIEPQNGSGFFKVAVHSREKRLEADFVLHRLVKAEHLKIRSFRPIEPSLEDIFLTATRRSWESPLESDS